MNYYEQLIQNENNFSKELMKDYPSLFYTNAAGELVGPSCGISCPDGWKPLVRDLCALIHAHNGDYRLLQTKNPYKRFKMWAYRKCFVPIHNFFWRLFDPRSTSKKTMWIVSELNALENKHPIRIKCRNAVQNFGNWFRPIDYYEKVPNKVAKIGQIKQKWNLTIYMDNADDRVYGMIDMATKFASNICEVTGEAGVKCHRGGWIRTLSLDKAKELEYIPVDETTRTD